MNIFDIIGGLLNQGSNKTPEVKVPYRLEEDSFEEVNNEEPLNAQNPAKESVTPAPEPIPPVGVKAQSESGYKPLPGGFKYQPLKHGLNVLRTAKLASVRSAGFGMVRNGGTRPHQGVDLAVPNNYRCYAVDDGIVSFVKTSDDNGYGRMLIIKLDGGLFVAYAHLKDILVKEGQRVKAGDVVALTGSSGNARTMRDMPGGSHLHFEVRTSQHPGKGLAGRIDPLKYFTPDTYNKSLYQ